MTTTMTSTLQADIERRLAATEPDVEVLLAEVVGGRLLRVFIDHPRGVTLDLCERVSAQLNELRERYSLEVSSPGAQRPLTKPAHYRRFVGRRARVRTRHPRPVRTGREHTTEGAGSEGAGSQGASSQRASSQGAGSQGAGSRGAASQGAGSQGASSQGAGSQGASSQGAGSERTGPESTRGPVSSFTGELISASEDEVTLAAGEGVVTIPYAEIRRCNLVEE